MEMAKLKNGEMAKWNGENEIAKWLNSSREAMGRLLPFSFAILQFRNFAISPI
jgi:hypothetical protein